MSCYMQSYAMSYHIILCYVVLCLIVAIYCDDDNLCCINLHRTCHVNYVIVIPKNEVKTPCKTLRIQQKKSRGLRRKRVLSSHFHTLRSNYKDLKPLEKIENENISEKDENVVFQISKELSRFLVSYLEGISRY